MELRPLGNTGLKVSAVGFGASPLGSHYSPVAQDDAIAAVRDHFFYSFTSSRHLSSSLHTVFYLLLMMRERSDEITSKYLRKLSTEWFSIYLWRYYGGTLSEKVLGKALKALQVSRGDYIVATKCGRYEEGFDFSAERVRKRHRRELGESSVRLCWHTSLPWHLSSGLLIRFTSLSLGLLVSVSTSANCCFMADRLLVKQFLLSRNWNRKGRHGLLVSRVFHWISSLMFLIDVILSYCHYSINDSKLLPYLKSKGVGVITASPLAMGLFTEQGPPEWHPASPEIKVWHFSC